MDQTPRMIPRHKQMSMSFATPFSETLSLEDRIDQLEYRINAFHYNVDSIQVDDNTYKWTDILKRMEHIHSKTREIQRNLPENLLLIEKKSEDLEGLLTDLQPVNRISLEIGSLHDSIQLENRNTAIKQQLMSQLDQLQNSINYLRSDIFRQQDEIDELRYKV